MVCGPRTDLASRLESVPFESVLGDGDPAICTPDTKLSIDGMQRRLGSVCAELMLASIEPPGLVTPA